MGRISARIARVAREEWARSLAGVTRATQSRPRAGEEMGRGLDYDGADSRWACNRKKAYSTKHLADKVAARINESNLNGTGNPGFEGVMVVPYFCRRCGEYHIGR